MTIPFFERHKTVMKPSCAILLISVKLYTWGNRYTTKYVEVIAFNSVLRLNRIVMCTGRSFKHK